MSHDQHGGDPPSEGPEEAGEKNGMPWARWIYDAQKKRSKELILQTDEPGHGRFAWRRVPGTAALAFTNLMASGLLLESSVFETTPFLVFARTISPAWVWGALFLVSGIVLFIAALTQRLVWLNVGSVVSLFVWTAICLAGIAAWFIGQVALSPIAGALYFWMMAGQAAMLFTPLVEHRYSGDAL